MNARSDIGERDREEVHF